MATQKDPVPLGRPNGRKDLPSQSDPWPPIQSPQVSTPAPVGKTTGVTNWQEHLEDSFATLADVPTVSHFWGFSAPWAYQGLVPAPPAACYVGFAALQQKQAPGKQPDTKDPAIETLDLSDTAKKAAYELKKKHPSVVFTSGRRDKAGQARAMASNVVSNRNWIKETYRKSEASDACQKWVDDHKDKKSKKEIADGLTEVLDGLTDEQLAKLSKHLSGDAFDVQPVDKDADAIKKTIRGLPGLDKFLDKEGGLVRWHAQF